MIHWDREKILVSMRFNVLYSLEGSILIVTVLKDNFSNIVSF